MPCWVPFPHKLTKGVQWRAISREGEREIVVSTRITRRPKLCAGIRFPETIKL